MLNDDKKRASKGQRQGWQKSLEILASYKVLKDPFLLKSQLLQNWWMGIFQWQLIDTQTVNGRPCPPPSANLGFQSPPKCPHWLSSSSFPWGKAIPGKLAIISFVLASSSLIPLFLSFSKSFSLVICQQPCLGLWSPKNNGSGHWLGGHPKLYKECQEGFSQVYPILSEVPDSFSPSLFPHTSSLHSFPFQARFCDSRSRKPLLRG